MYDDDGDDNGDGDDDKEEEVMPELPLQFAHIFSDTTLHTMGGKVTLTSNNVLIIADWTTYALRADWTWPKAPPQGLEQYAAAPVGPRRL